jgi:hypothetical protein
MVFFYSNHNNWEITPLAATSHASKRTQVFPFNSSVALRVCFPKATDADSKQIERF